MGLTLIAILTAALLLPGILAARAFYQASKTGEVEPSIPTLSSMDGIALVGLFSVVVHVAFVAALTAIASLPPVLPLPLADPYQLFTAEGGRLPGRDAAFALFFGLAWLCATALVVGFAGGRLMMRLGDKSIFYGALADVIAAGAGDNRFIAAYVLTKIRHDRRAIGYQGSVHSLIRDDDRFPAKLVLKNASIFYLDFGGDQPERREQPGLIDWITLSSADWENVAFQVIEMTDEPVPGDPVVAGPGSPPLQTARPASA